MMGQYSYADRIFSGFLNDAIAKRPARCNAVVISGIEDSINRGRDVIEYKGTAAYYRI